MNLGKLELLEKQLRDSMDRGEIAGGILKVIYKGKEVYYAEAGDGKRDNLYRLYSMSKPITAAAAYILLERGELDLLDPVSKYIPGFKNMTVASENGIENAKREIRIKDLLDMTSGLCYGGEPTLASSDVQTIFDDICDRLYTNNQVTTLEFGERMSHVHLAFQPGEHWKYGTSADVLGVVIEIASKMKLGDFLEKEIFEPLGMKDTAFNVPKEKLHRLVKAYEQTPDGLIVYDGDNLGICNHMDVENKFESGGAGLVSTIDDYAKFTQMLMNGGTFDGKEILAKSTVELFTKSYINGVRQDEVEMWDNLAGFSYGNLNRVCTNPERSNLNVVKGEYGWDGWLGCYFTNMPSKDCTFLLMVQKKDAGTFTLTRRCRNVLATAFD